ncbi:hypothetical protein M422DRAFT_255292 [Sphaerobolus stellatus SS14]|uniref:Uncharacterized protein n=1 Tax=Sphaerobolus stellatus (strain SS14) TaxID=990650 RepID=A0A0C9V437_SPHS4|nr:hypothetical protein M422DRAFT_255292 [Sphaerobolus stellatus SS14]
MIQPEKTDDHWAHGDPGEYQYIGWFHEWHPQLALIPQFPQFEGVVLNHWKSHYFIAKKLLQNATVHQHIEASWLPLPSNYGYRNNHKRARWALKCAEQSRNAFLGLLATVTLGIVLFQRDTTFPSVTSPWIDYISRFEGVDRAWVEDLARSFVGDFSFATTRIGTIVNMKKLPTWEIIWAFLCIDVPIWYFWGELDSKPYRTKIRIFDNFAPPIMNQQEIDSYYTQPVSSAAQAHHALIPSYGSGQQTGEHWKVFFERDKERHE